MTIRQLADRSSYIIGPLILLGTWEILTRTGVLKETYFPPPSALFFHISILFDSSSGLAHDLYITIIRVLITIGVAAVAGALFGIAITLTQTTERGFGAILAFLYPIPGILFFPFLTFLLGRGELSVILASVELPFIVIALYAVAGVHSIDERLLEAARNYGCKGLRFLTKVLLPGSLSSIVTGIRVALGFSLIVVIAVEMVGAQDGLGQFLWQNWQILRVSDMYVALILVAILGVLSTSGFEAVANKLLPWRASEEQV